MIYDTMKNGTYGAEAQGLDVSPYPNLVRICKAVECILNMGGIKNMRMAKGRKQVLCINCKGDGRNTPILLQSRSARDPDYAVAGKLNEFDLDSP